MRRQRGRRAHVKCGLAGITLVELMVSLLIGSLIMIGAVQILANGSSNHRVAESVSRLEEIARFAIATLEFDTSLAGFYGLTSHAVISLAAAPVANAGISVINDCGPNWAVNIETPIGGRNNAYAWACTPYGNSATPGADSLVIRRVASDRAGARESGRLYVQSTRIGTTELLRGTEPGAAPNSDLSAVHELVVHGYYVSTTSSLSTPGNAVPSLRMKTLVGGSLGPRIVDQEVFPGVEDMQIEFGVDTDTAGANGRSNVDVYVNADDPIFDAESPEFLPHATVRAVRIWLLVRTQLQEVGFVNTRQDAYADRLVEPRADAYRRELVSTTVYLRNTGGGEP